MSRQKNVIKLTSLVSMMLALTGCPRFPYSCDEELPAISSMSILPDSVINLETRKYQSCDDLKSDLRTLQAAQSARDLARNSTRSHRSTSRQCGNAPTSLAGAGQPDQSSKSRLESGRQTSEVAEADIVLENTQFIFVARKKIVEVIDKLTLTSAYQISLGLYQDPELFADDSGLTIISKTRPGLIARGRALSRIQVYEFKLASQPSLVFEKTWSGSWTDARKSGDQLTLKIDDFTDINNIKSSEISEVNCRDVFSPISSGSFWMISKIINLNLRTHHFQSTGFIGGGGHLLVGKNASYFAESASGTVNSRPRSQTRITSLPSYQSDDEPGSVMAEGLIRNRWSMHELAGGELAAVLTKSSFPTGLLAHSVRVFARFGSSVLREISTSSEFGIGETVEAVRYENDISYVVTFRNQDPLHAIDLRNPKKPVLIGVEEASGYSSFLYPLGQNLMLGVGRNISTNSWGRSADSGLLLSVFGAGQVPSLALSAFGSSQSSSLALLYQKPIGNSPSFSDAESDPQSLYINLEQRIISIPVVEVFDNPSMGYPSSITGANFYRIDSTLTNVAHQTHFELIPASCQKQKSDIRASVQGRRSFDINRTIAVDRNFITVSRFGIKVHPRENLSTTTATVVFGSAESDCN
jgi:hypothetical protein